MKCNTIDCARNNVYIYIQGGARNVIPLIVHVTMYIYIYIYIYIYMGGDCRIGLVNSFATTEELLWSAAILVHCVAFQCIANSACFKEVMFCTGQ